MAGKTNTSATFFAQKKLLGKAHTSNLKTDGEELIGSNIQTATSHWPTTTPIGMKHLGKH